jgi:hypothetical protein
MLFAQPQPLDDFAISFCVVVLEIGQMSSPLANQLVQSASRVIVVFVQLQMLGQLADPGGQQRNLHLWRTGVARVDIVFLDDV